MLPRVIARPTATKPIRIETRAPKTTREKISPEFIRSEDIMRTRRERLLREVLRERIAACDERREELRKNDRSDEREADERSGRPPKLPPRIGEKVRPGAVVASEKLGAPSGATVVKVFAVSQDGGVLHRCSYRKRRGPLPLVSCSLHARVGTRLRK